MLMDYINKNFVNGEPIFLNELPCSSYEALRQAMKKLTDEGKIKRLFNGVYYKPYKTILGTEGKVSVKMYIKKKLLKENDTTIGYICGIGLYNMYGFTTQVPSVTEVISNTSTTKQRALIVDGYKIIVYQPLFVITNDNVNELEFLTLMTDLDKYSEITGDELKAKINEYIKEKNINFDVVKELIPSFPDRVFKNFYNGGLINALV